MRKRLSGKRNCEYETQTERKHEIEDTYGKKGEVKCRVQEIRDVACKEWGLRDRRDNKKRWSGGQRRVSLEAQLCAANRATNKTKKECICTRTVKKIRDKKLSYKSRIT